VRQPPGWYANDETTERYWDGRQWTESRKRDRVSRPDHSEPVQRSVSIRLVGRGSDCDIRLSDATVSTHHANLVITASGTLLRDLRSSNGTFVNRKRIDEAEIHEGDEILFGMCRTIWQGGSLNQEPLVR
jgi:pSer/pThr/pTyr-binding forkhead associated (FHA) protein